jgi:AraC family transcriptional regulator
MGRFYGDAIANSFRLKRVPAITTRSSQGTPISVTRLSIGADQIGMSARVPAEDTFILALYLTDVSYHELWRGRRKSIAQGYSANSMRLVNLMDDCSANITCPHESMVLYLPRAALNEFLEERGGQTVRHLDCVPGTRDPIVSQISDLLAPSLAHPGRTSTLFTDHLVLTLCAHLTATYGSHSLRGAKKFGQPHLRRALDYMSGHFRDDISLAEVAQHCGISRSYFAQSFKAATGHSPHRWMQIYRIEKAKKLLSSSSASIAEVAMLCGFADQSHMTRVFSRFVGESPGGWRKRRG